MPAKKKCHHKYKYPRTMLRKDGCLKKAARKKAASWRATHTQGGKRRSRKR